MNNTTTLIDQVANATIAAMTGGGPPPMTALGAFLVDVVNVTVYASYISIIPYCFMVVALYQWVHLDISPIRC